MLQHIDVRMYVHTYVVTYSIYICMYVCTVEPLYDGHHWGNKSVLYKEVSFIQGFVNYSGTCVLWTPWDQQKVS